MWEAPYLVIKAVRLSLEQWPREEGLDMARFSGQWEDYGEKIWGLLRAMTKSSDDLIILLK